MTEHEPEPYPATPALDYQLEVVKHRHSQEIGEFLEWLHSRGMIISEWWVPDEDPDEPALLPVRLTISELLAEYFDVDLKECETERRELLEWMRRRQQ